MLVIKKIIYTYACIYGKLGNCLLVIWMINELKGKFRNPEPFKSVDIRAITNSQPVTLANNLVTLLTN